MGLKAIAGILSTMLLIGMLTLAFNIQRVEAPEPPATEWTRTYGGAYEDRAHSVVETGDGGYALAGSTESFGVSKADFWLVKVDSSGNIQWSRTYGGADYERAWSVVKTGDGGYAIAGYTRSFGVGLYDFWLVKTDSSGNMQWNKTYGGDGTDYVHSIVQTSDGGYALAGYTSSFGAGGYDFWLVKVNSSGNVQWNKTYGGAGWDEAYSIQQAVDGGYVLAGRTDSFGAGRDDFWLVKTDSSGNIQWNKTYGATTTERAHSLVKTTDGGYAIAGYTNSSGVGYFDFWLVKVDSSGNMQWARTYGGADFEQAHSVIQTTDGGYAIAGRTDSFGVGNADFWLVKTDSSGNMQWNKTCGGANYDEAHSVVQTSDGRYAIAGYTNSFGAGTDDFWLVKVASGPTPNEGDTTHDDKSGLLAPYIGLAITIILVIVATVVSVKLKKKKR